MIGQRSNKIDVNRFSFLGNIEMNGNDICVGIGFKSENFCLGKWEEFNIFSLNCILNFIRVYLDSIHLP